MEICPDLIAVFSLGILTLCNDYHTIAIVGEKVLIILLVTVNLAAGFGLAVPIARLLGEVTGRPTRFSRYFAILVGAYFVECVAFSAGMGTQVFSIGLAFLWGVVLGLWLRRRAAPQKVLKTSFLFALFSSLPTVSFGVLILLAWLVGGWLIGGRTITETILSTEAGADLGIPDFVPWPLNTILGFCLALVIGTVVLKTVITTVEVSLLIHLRRNASFAAENL